MKVHTTNYYHTFIQIAEDSPVAKGEIPPLKGDKKTVALLQFELILKNPYSFTSDEVLFRVFADRSNLMKSEYEEARKQYFSKGQACFRASPLMKRYGWGLHCNKDGKIALIGAETVEYTTFSADKQLTILKAMRSSK